eukprot:gene5748-6451_t
MTRSRRQREHERPPKHTKEHVDRKRQKSTKDDYMSVFSTIAVGFLLIALVIAAVQYWSYVSIARLYTPLNEPKMSIDSEEDISRLWGSYRSNLYFGMRTRTPDSLMFGMMWFSQFPKAGQLRLRYSCEQGDNLPKYGWLKHDGRTFGSQEIVDDDFILTTDFVKKFGGQNGGDWTARIKGRARFSKGVQQLVSLLFIFTNEGQGNIEPKIKDNHLMEISGYNPVLGKYKVKFPKTENLLETYLTSYEEDVYDEKNIILKNLQYYRTIKNSDQNRLIGLTSQNSVADGKKPNFLVRHVLLKLPFEVEVLFQSGSFVDRPSDLSGDVFNSLFQQQQKTFDSKFDSKFNLTEKSFTPNQIDFAKAALSNMVGGMGYFYGKSRVQSRFFKEPVDYWASDLYTGVPSRSFFPRGFLWDEGFHQLLISQWDRDISRDAIAHWLDLLNANGWIPREQILGSEARKKVPAEFVVQHSENANPPTLFLAIQSILKYERKVHGNISKETELFLRKAFGRLQAWFKWYNTTQIGKEPASYRWRGRDAKTNKELNPKTLTSGLDDYPRCSHPSEVEKHVDLRCWMALASGTLADIAKLIGQPSDRYAETFDYLKDNNLLDKQHWSPNLNAYCDYGQHTKFVALEQRPVRKEPGSPMHTVRVVKSKTGPSLKFVQAYGYVSLFPFLLKILDPSSDKLKRILEDMTRPELLWTKFGLRSLARNDPLYMKRNTEHDPPYWRGPIWMNMNYLAVSALHHYANVEGPNRALSGEIYTQLRRNLISNVHNNYIQTGYIWEQYNDVTGKGQGCYPFTGWSALVTLIMGEIY